MASKNLFDILSFETSKNTTLKYSTSFSRAIRVLHARFHEPIFNIYGFVRFADEIVDSFHEYDKETLLAEFIYETKLAIQRRISLNPILNSFQKTVHQYQIDEHLIETFFNSMKADLKKQSFTDEEYKEYIFGSAEVVGLMCLRVFTENNEKIYEELKSSAMRLGAAFQKINFLRDLREDSQELNRVYFPGIQYEKFCAASKQAIENDIQQDFDEGFKGITKLPKSARFGVYLAYVYYKSLFKKIKKVKPEKVMTTRIRIPDAYKIFLLCNSYLRHNLNLL